MLSFSNIICIVLEVFGLLPVFVCEHNCLLGSFGRGYCDGKRVSQNGLMNIDNSVGQDSCICGGILLEGGGGAFGLYLHTWCNILKVSTGSEEGRYGKSWCCEKNRRNPPLKILFYHLSAGEPFFLYVVVPM